MNFALPLTLCTGYGSLTSSSYILFIVKRCSRVSDTSKSTLRVELRAGSWIAITSSFGRLTCRRAFRPVKKFWSSKNPRCVIVYFGATGPLGFVVVRVEEISVISGFDDLPVCLTAGAGSTGDLVSVLVLVLDFDFDLDAFFFFVDLLFKNPFFKAGFVFFFLAGFAGLLSWVVAPLSFGTFRMAGLPPTHTVFLRM